MKKIVFKTGSPEESLRAGQALSEMSGVMVSRVEGDRLIVHCGQQMDPSALLRRVDEAGAAATLEVIGRGTF